MTFSAAISSSVIRARASAQLAAITLRLSRIARRDADHATLDAACAKEDPAGRAEFAALPAGVDPFEHSRDKGALEIGARRQQTRLQQRAMHVADGVPARLVSLLQWIEHRSACHAQNVAIAGSARPFSSPYRSKLYEA